MALSSQFRTFAVKGVGMPVWQLEPPTANFHDPLNGKNGVATMLIAHALSRQSWPSHLQDPPCDDPLADQLPIELTET